MLTSIQLTRSDFLPIDGIIISMQFSSVDASVEERRVQKDPGHVKAFTYSLYIGMLFLLKDVKNRYFF
jgi:hypothetical protein